MPKHPKPAKSRTSSPSKSSRVGGALLAVGKGVASAYTGGLSNVAIAAAQRLLPGRTSKADAMAYLRRKKKKSAKMLLKRAYERRARRQIQAGNLGRARRSLSAKRSVV